MPKENAVDLSIGNQENQAGWPLVFLFVQRRTKKRNGPNIPIFISARNQASKTPNPSDGGESFLECYWKTQAKKIQGDHKHHKGFRLEERQNECKCEVDDKDPLENAQYT